MIVRVSVLALIATLDTVEVDERYDVDGVSVENVRSAVEELAQDPLEYVRGGGFARMTAAGEDDSLRSGLVTKLEQWNRTSLLGRRERGRLAPVVLGNELFELFEDVRQREREVDALTRLEGVRESVVAVRALGPRATTTSAGRG